ncbi:MAG: pyridoxal phosphate-dependent aminotransferase [Armatimonadota bacterium]|nr:pyridoxal phosphate-dependent aminotransferase [Armatimonadota bacterium]MDR7485262.1 pyridoxal phosphate-dependent aminotransferase [Armatimonadota bacterium]MDR7533900.1 pyridoxal phosphate-dependent aminotransferase [Armatimonadota bacterium]MDR7537138.1 pyridoxal phosphate-dependent aminotransferase [Armatimonadota bacterium]
MELEWAARMNTLGTETAFEVLARAKRLEAQGRQIIHLEIGEPDFDTPPHIVEAAIKALRDGYTHYTPAPGIWEVRAAIADYVARTRGIPVRPEQVVVTPGSKNVLLFAMLALVDPGDEVIYPDPGYPIYESVARFVGATLRPVRLREERDFAFDLDEFRALLSPRTRMVVLNSPHNPCGSLLDRRTLEAVAEAVLPTRAVVLSDEIYGRIAYDGRAFSIASLPGMQDRTIILDGLSKTYAMTGWRVGFGVMRPELVERMAQLLINSSSCAAAFSQMAAIAALQGPQDAVEAMIAEFRARRQLIVDALNSLEGVRCRMPGGAFYAFPNVSAIAADSKRLADFLLEEAGVACLAGTSFGSGGEGFLRFSYATSRENIREGMRRLREALPRYRPTVRA